MSAERGCAVTNPLDYENSLDVEWRKQRRRKIARGILLEFLAASFITLLIVIAAAKFAFRPI